MQLSNVMSTTFSLSEEISQGTSLHVHKSLIFVNEGDFGINISLI